MSDEIKHIAEWLGVDSDLEVPPTLWPGNEQPGMLDDIQVREKLNYYTQLYTSEQMDAQAVVADLKRLIPQIKDFSLKQTANDLIAAIITKWVVNNINTQQMSPRDAISHLVHARELTNNDKLQRGLTHLISKAQFQSGLSTPDPKEI
jgi:hypothetical protein